MLFISKSIIEALLSNTVFKFISKFEYFSVSKPFLNQNFSLAFCVYRA